MHSSVIVTGSERRLCQTGQSFTYMKQRVQIGTLGLERTRQESEIQMVNIILSYTLTPVLNFLTRGIHVYIFNANNAS